VIGARRNVAIVTSSGVPADSASKSFVILDMAVQVTRGAP
jgi:hypothetical protein